jgi:hypothetical protein
MLTREVLLPWVRVQYGWRHAEARVHDRGHAFLVDTQPDDRYDNPQVPATAGNGPTLVLKENGAFFRLSSNPTDLAVYQAPDERAFRAALQESRRSLAEPDGYVPQPGPVSLEQVMAWMRGQRHRSGDSIHDAGFGYWVVAPADGGALSMVVKHNGAVWTTSTHPDTVRLRGARSEQEFHDILGGIFPGIDPGQPTEWLPQLPHPAPVGGVTRDRVVGYAAAVYGPRHAEGRVSETAFGFWVNTQPDAYMDGNEWAMTYGNGPTLIMKSNGSIWNLASNPDSLPLYNATSEQEFYDTYRRILRDFDPNKPSSWLT